MLVDYVSDLHINHHVRFETNDEDWEIKTREWSRKLIAKKKGEVLIAAGDFSEWNRQSLWFLDEAAKHYEKVFFVVGNHDYYLLNQRRLLKYQGSTNRVRKLVADSRKIKNVVPLVREVFTYKGKKIAGDSLWYMPETEKEWKFYREESSDSAYIVELDEKNYIMETGDVAKMLFDEASSWYTELEGQNIDLMISHVPPVLSPFSPFEKNALYEFPAKFLAANKWVCGHQHAQGDFEKAGTKFYMNPVGYPDEGNEFGVRTFKI